MLKKVLLILASYTKTYYFCITLKQRSKKNGFLAQLVEQWIENPCVPGSIPGETTLEKPPVKRWFSFQKSFNVNL